MNGDSTSTIARSCRFVTADDKIFTAQRYVCNGNHRDKLSKNIPGWTAIMKLFLMTACRWRVPMKAYRKLEFGCGGWYTLWPVSVCPSACPAQVGVLSKRLIKSSWFWHGSFLPPTIRCVMRKFGISKNKGTSLSQTPYLENFATGYRSSKCVINLTRQGWR